MKDPKSVEVGDSILAGNKKRLMIVTEVSTEHTFLNGETYVYPRPFVKAKIVNPVPAMLSDSTVFTLFDRWEFSAIYHTPGSTGDGLKFNERVV